MCHPHYVSLYLVTIVGPGTERQVAFLAVKGEVGDVHHAGALGDGRSIPGYLPIVAQSHICVHRPREVIVSPVGGEKVEAQQFNVACVM